MAADDELGPVCLPIGIASGDVFGLDRRRPAGGAYAGRSAGVRRQEQAPRHMTQEGLAHGVRKEPWMSPLNAPCVAPP